MNIKISYTITLCIQGPGKVALFLVGWDGEIVKNSKIRDIFLRANKSFGALQTCIGNKNWFINRYISNIFLLKIRPI